MSGASEAAAAMANRDLFGLSPVAVHSPAPALNSDSSQPQMEQQMHMPYAPDDGFRQMAPSPPPPYQSITGGATVIHQAPNMNSGEQKRKRGRPRRYGPEGGMNVSTDPPPQQQPQTFSPSAPAPAPAAPQTEVPPGGSASPTAKKARGRPRGSHNKKQQKRASGSSGTGFIPHIVTVNAGEDISSKILAVSQNGPRAICILSANGAISHVTLRQAATSGGTATYEGRFDILSLSGSFMLHEVAGQRSRTGGISVSLAGPDGRVLGGSVAGLLVAASPSQVVVGCFEPDAHKESARNHTDPSTFQPKTNHGGAVGPSSSPSRGTLSESSGGPASPLNLSSGACIDFPEGMSGMPWK
ncbi:putative DNA-binding protein escarola [Phtheirospermum japonicum]|uniref:AT-hook motif nuclear-localized protein n=1 Tax=Phtheirospermum japonicum TaxID=374723 RepID=A0A830D7X3_9LAMI|nr:putative DNA-binding protein escarola [Phtheirospermum japonicum]